VICRRGARVRQAATSRWRAPSPWLRRDDGGGGMAKENGQWQGSAWVGVGCARVCLRRPVLPGSWLVTGEVAWRQFKAKARAWLTASVCTHARESWHPRPAAWPCHVGVPASRSCGTTRRWRGDGGCGEAERRDGLLQQGRHEGRDRAGGPRAKLGMAHQRCRQHDGDGKRR
jgi:hypothetical protein